MGERRFPILKNPSNWRHWQKLRPSIPWGMIEPHHAQAAKNHDQTLERLAHRGGLSLCEALAVLEDRAWRRMDQIYAATVLALMEVEYLAGDKDA